MNDRRNYFMINLHERMGLGRDRTRDPWICSQPYATVGKLFTRILNNRLREWAETYGVLIVARGGGGGGGG